MQKLSRWVKGPHLRRYPIKEYPFKIQREKVIIETVDAIIVANSKTHAEKMAVDLGNGQRPEWPLIKRYNVSEAEDIRHELIDLVYVEPEKRRA